MGRSHGDPPWKSSVAHSTNASVLAVEWRIDGRTRLDWSAEMALSTPDLPKPSGLVSFQFASLPYQALGVTALERVRLPSIPFRSKDSVDIFISPDIIEAVVLDQVSFAT